MTASRKKVLKRIIVFTLTALLVIIGGRCIYVQAVIHNAYDVKPISKEQIKRADVNNANKLMIVAHPDDECCGAEDILWKADIWSCALPTEKTRCAQRNFTE